MTHYFSLEQIIALHERAIAQSGESDGVRNIGALESSVAQPQMTFDGVELYSSIAEKAAALAHSLVQNHSFVDGNKRVGHAAMEVFLVLNGYEVDANVDEQEKLFLELAAGQISRNELAEWLAQHIIERKN